VGGPVRLVDVARPDPRREAEARVVAALDDVVAGLSVSKVFPLAASTHSPSISRWPGLLTKSLTCRAGPSRTPAIVSIEPAGLAARFGVEIDMLGS
jgi:hypothetical protein